MKPQTKNKPQPPRCPICRKPGVPIEYGGYPSEEGMKVLLEQERRGEIIIGGCDCVVGEKKPAWQCTGAGRHRWGRI
jgi:hypothetical protein